MNIFVGNLSFETTDETLRSEFGAYGEITSVNILKDRMTNRSRGFGFVEMSNNDEAVKAIEGMNGKSIDGRTINAAEARPREEKSNDRSSRGSFTRNRTW